MYNGCKRCQRSGQCIWQFFQDIFTKEFSSSIFAVGCEFRQDTNTMLLNFPVPPFNVPGFRQTLHNPTVLPQSYSLLHSFISTVDSTKPSLKRKTTVCHCCWSRAMKNVPKSTAPPRGHAIALDVVGQRPFVHSTNISPSEHPNTCQHTHTPFVYVQDTTREISSKPKCGTIETTPSATILDSNQ